MEVDAVLGIPFPLDLELDVCCLRLRCGLFDWWPRRVRELDLELVLGDRGGEVKGTDTDALFVVWMVLVLL